MKIQKPSANNQIATTVTHIHYGPLPPAAEMEAYNKILPSSAERLFRLVEQEQEHDHQQRLNMLNNDRLYIESQTKISLRSLTYLFLLILFLLGAGVALILLNKDIAGASACVIAVCATFKYFSYFMKFPK